MKNFIDYILSIFIPEYRIILSTCYVNSESSNNTSNILYFSNNNPDNNEGSDSNDNQDSNSNGDSNSNDDDDLEKESNVEEIEDHNAPERIVDDLEMVDKARKNDPEALEYLSREYRHFFDDTTKDQALRDIEEYLESEFPKELERSEYEADALEAREKAKDIRNMVDALEKAAEDTSDSEKKERISAEIEALKDRLAEEEEKAEKAERAAKSYGYDSEEYEEEEEENNKSKRPLSSAGESEEKRNKRQKSNNDDGEDGNNSSGGGIGPSSSSGPSDPGPSNWSGGGGWSKIFVILGGLFETLSQVIENFINMM